MESILSITPIPLLSLLIAVILLVLAMYFARNPFHRSMASCGRIVYNGMRLAAAAVKSAEMRLALRNREVLLNAGVEMAERRIEREFDRIGFAVQRDLEGYPQVQRRLTEDLMKLEDDLEKSSAIPQALPDWVKVIDAIANIKPSGDRMVINMLEEIHHTLAEQHKNALERHRRDMGERHTILSRMLPFWRGVQKTLGAVERTINHLIQRSKKIDHYMAEYEKIQSHKDMAVRQLSSSSLTQFFISGVVLAVAVVGAIINFNLVALPMSEMVGGNSYIGDFRTSDVAGMFIVCLEIVLGFFVMDALRITRLFSIIGSMEDNKRKVIFWVLFAFLFILALVESSLAYMRDQIAADMEALRQSLAGIEGSEVASSNIPMYGQMIMGFILPFILTFVAIPFESFVSSFRTVLGVGASWLLRLVAFFLRLVGNIGFYAARLVVNLYDLIIFPAFKVESFLMQRGDKDRKEHRRTPSNGDLKEDAVQFTKPISQQKEAIE
ncbi:MAG: hypothetical protein HKP58_02185 [Desulfatitalea sp.]|nr:hypothetical protein [Desulfatitalea sp.]NNJ99198.1 hypothetical protein [Desulfatitalea sp.]